MGLIFIAWSILQLASLSSPFSKKFDKEIIASYGSLEKNPFFKVWYNNVRALPLKKFPFILFYTLNEMNKTVEIRSVFNTYQDPKKYPWFS